MRSVGFCLGASSVSMVEIEKADDSKVKIIKAESRAHDGNAKEMLAEMFEKNKLASVDKIAVTGRKFRNFVNFTSISEPEAVEMAYDHTKDKYGSPSVVVSAGGETFMVYELDRKGKIINVHTGNKCASGTGEFFLQQIKRMNLKVDQAVAVAIEEMDQPHKIAGRCSVFSKSDCTHALNKGVPKGRVAAGLCQMMSGKILELLKKTKSNNILLIGGTSKNRVMVEYIKREMEGIQVADEAQYFEALGTALWALENETIKILDRKYIFKEGQSSFSFLPALKEYENKVTFKNMERGTAKEGDRCIIGLDVGSTTTKAVLLRTKDDALLNSIYLRTNGDPIRASKECYEELSKQLNGTKINIVGLGVTGSGRQIAGLHALTEGVINEIIAHATAAVHFDPQVDTIFEIGGQDAKYTYITNRVPSDYAMNEACSAGTGSFLEESAKESMGIDTTEIAGIALKSTNPPNFNDQCAAFISSDIKNAIQEGISREDIVAGLVYSICQNYSNRVKGNRAVGKKIFMQGGVCYNKAVPVAMAAFTGNEIIVPPEPGLMGAYGVALEVKNKIDLGLMQEKTFDLDELKNREVKYDSNFKCAGGKEKCDRGCIINMIEINGKRYPFGGACNKYVNMLRNVEYDVEKLDLIVLREKLAFEKYVPKEKNNPNGKKIGISKSLLVNTLYPLYYEFFTHLGLNVVLSDKVDNEGVERKGAAFCYPIELSHGFMGNMLKEELDYIFLPQIIGMYVENGINSSVVCPFVQGEPYYLRTTFKELKGRKVLSPVLNFTNGYYAMSGEFENLAKELGFTRKEGIKAYKAAFENQRKFLHEMQEIGQNVLTELELNPDKIGIVAFGRPYNAMTQDANMGIPHKFASRGYTVIPLDFLPYVKEEPTKQMYWAMGQMILKAAKYVEKHPQLFGTYITNFSCGPDSFLVGYFRNIMGQKPSLTLELDSHTADAGVDTRVEAFLDVVSSYIELKNQGKNIKELESKYRMAVTSFEDGKLFIIDSKGQKYSIKDKHVHVLIPSMGDAGSRLVASAFRYAGVNASNLEQYTDVELKKGRANSSCKECLPLMLTIGGLLDYTEKRESSDELLVYFMPETSGPCRFGQYNILMQNVIKKNKIEDVALLSLTSENSYAGLDTQFQLRAWRAIIISDVLDDIYSALLVLAQDKDYALRIYEESVRKIVNSVAKDDWKRLQITLKEVADTLMKIPINGTLHDAKKVGVVGEIFVRRDSFSRQHLVERLAEKDIITKVAPIAEWLYYIDYLIKKAHSHLKPNFSSRIMTTVKGFFKRKDESIIKTIMAESGLYELQMTNIDKVVNNVQNLISPKLTGEAILTVGTALTEIIDEVDGIIAIGPFGCMPNRISESIIGQSINTEKRNIASDDKEIVTKVMNEYPALPFLAIESDGNVFPQVIEARLESFCLQVDRINGYIKKQRKHKGKVHSVHTPRGSRYKIG